VAAYLADTHLLLWAASAPRRLGKAAADIIGDIGNEVLFSAASIWEIAIKSSLGRSDFRVDAAVFAEALRTNGFTELPVRAVHAARVATLPALHADPFDRILVAQAQSEGVTLLTRDEAVAQYPGPIRLV
jgi:PIN domain nuclease of toxin-antitoxin system